MLPISVHSAPCVQVQYPFQCSNGRQDNPPIFVHQKNTVLQQGKHPFSSHPQVFISTHAHFPGRFRRRLPPCRAFGPEAHFKQLRKGLGLRPANARRAGHVARSWRGRLGIFGGVLWEKKSWVSWVFGNLGKRLCNQVDLQTLASTSPTGHVESPSKPFKSSSITCVRV